MAAVVLTGTLDDGTAGALAVRRHGGIVVAQDPADAAYAGMPGSGVENLAADYVLPLSEIPSKILAVTGNGTRSPAARPFAVDPRDAKEVSIDELDMEAIEDVNHRGKPSTFACPDCKGILWEIEDNGLLRYRCRVGHAYTMRTLSMEQSERLEEALWTAFRAMEETAALHRRMADRAGKGGNNALVAKHEAAAKKQERSARTLRLMILEPRPEVELGGT